MQPENWLLSVLAPPVLERREVLGIGSQYVVSLRTIATVAGTGLGKVG